MTIHDLLGGELLIAEVLRTDGSRQGVHYWNLPPDGTEVDLTREQFAGNEVVQEPRFGRRPAGLPKRGAQAVPDDETPRLDCSRPSPG